MAKAHRYADEVERAFEALSVRSWRDEEEATKVRKEQDELLQKDAETQVAHWPLLDGDSMGSARGQDRTRRSR